MNKYVLKKYFCDRKEARTGKEKTLELAEPYQQHLRRHSLDGLNSYSGLAAGPTALLVPLHAA